MTQDNTTQLSFDFNPRLPARFPTWREYVRFLVDEQSNKERKEIAGDLDISPSGLNRKLSPSDNDSQRLNLDDLEGLCKSLGPQFTEAAIGYLVAKFCDRPEAKKQRAVNDFMKLMSQASELLPRIMESK